MSSDVEALLGLAPLEVGQRVRVRLSGECESCSVEGTVEIVDGAIGIVGECPYGPGAVFGGTERYYHEHAPGHEINVQFEWPIQSERWGVVTGGCYARAELERLSKETV